LWQGFFWEAKAPGKRPSPAQIEWMDKRRQSGIEAVWLNEFQTRDRLSPAIEPRDSPVFVTWFSEYFTAKVFAPMPPGLPGATGA
jgi:hypothetical protein